MCAKKILSTFFDKTIDFKTILTYNHNYLLLKGLRAVVLNRKIFSNDFKRLKREIVSLSDLKTQYFVETKKIEKKSKKSLKILKKRLT